MRVFTAIAIATCFTAGIATAQDQGKPDLSGSLVVSIVQCPDEPTRGCVFLNKGDVFWVAKGNGYGKEEKIWLVDNEKIKKANDKTPYQKYMKLVWQSTKGMT